MLLTVAPVVKIDSLKDLPNLGTALRPDQINFRWPTEGDLKELDQNEPLKLKTVHTRGHNPDFLTSIQFIFTNGVESPVFDSGNI